jgi:hypothetical protein
LPIDKKAKKKKRGRGWLEKHKMGKKQEPPLSVVITLWSIVGKQQMGIFLPKNANKKEAKK